MCSMEINIFHFAIYYSDKVLWFLEHLKSYQQNNIILNLMAVLNKVLQLC